MEKVCSKLVPDLFFCTQSFFMNKDYEKKGPGISYRLELVLSLSLCCQTCLQKFLF